jgi:hypothetical protein
MIGEHGLLELLRGAIEKDYFSSEFLVSLKNSLDAKIQNMKKL